MGTKSRRKGQRNEVALAHALGNGAVRVPLSGAHGGVFAGDVLWRGLRVESKVRADGFREIYRWLVGADLLALRADGQGWIICCPLERFLALVGGE
jgi:hypothetical protein